MQFRITHILHLSLIKQIDLSYFHVALSEGFDDWKNRLWHNLAFNLKISIPHILKNQNRRGMRLSCHFSLPSTPLNKQTDRLRSLHLLAVLFSSLYLVSHSPPPALEPRVAEVYLSAACVPVGFPIHHALAWNLLIVSVHLSIDSKKKWKAWKGDRERLIGFVDHLFVLWINAENNV